MSTGPPASDLASPAGAATACRRRALLSFERPRAGDPRTSASAELENCTNGQINGYSPCVRFGARRAHRQDSKGTRWMPWHQEPKKDVDGCDKPR